MKKQYDEKYEFTVEETGFPQGRFPERTMNPPLLYRAARRGTFGQREEYVQGSITDALFVYLDGAPEPETAAAVDERFRVRPLVCLTDAWERHIRARYPDAKVYTRYMMKPANRFTIPEGNPLPEEYRITRTDETAFSAHPFGHGVNYLSYEAFRAEGAGAVVYRGERIAASASSFLSLDGEAELDVTTAEGYRGKGLAAACIAMMLQDCEERGITVHWDAQNEVSRHLAAKFGFEEEMAYQVYWLPEKEEQNNGSET